jgi:hypothetical protein
LIRALRTGRKTEAIVAMMPEQVFKGERTLADFLGCSLVLKTLMKRYNCGENTTSVWYRSPRHNGAAIFCSSICQTTHIMPSHQSE